MVILFIIIGYNTFSQDSVREHIVTLGESLYKISMKYDVTIDDIKEFNGLTSDVIFVNQVINIPVKDTLSIDFDSVKNLDYYKRTCVRKIYYSQIGIREETGNNDGFHVEKYLASAGLDKGYPWCAAFVNWTLNECDIYPNIKYKAWVPSYFPDDKLIMVRGQFELREPVFGDLIGIWFESKGRLAHIGFYDGENSKYYFTVEGNTNEPGSDTTLVASILSRDGDGVYRKRRIKRQVHSISSWIEN